MKVKIDIKHTAKLANLHLTDTETVKFEKQLSSVIAYIEKLKEIDTKNIIQTSQVTGLINVTKKDILKTSLTQEEALSNTAKTHDGYIEVNEILDKI